MAGVILPYRDKFPRIHPTAFIAETAVIIGDVEIGADSGIWFGAVVRGDVNSIRIGQRTNIQDGTVIHVTANGHNTVIGDDVTVGHLAMIHASTLEDCCFVGMKACIMDGVVVEGGSMVAAGALVTPDKRVVQGQLWAGVPARPSRALTAEEQAYFPVSAANYVKLAAEYRARFTA
ncbi:MAG: gamma carbonic anhydrase family protein [Azospirillaceae bacterium]|nr:gamma carbonic anhydrase family protein [Azospirillaceae bacterium]